MSNALPTVTTTETLPEYPCDICGHDVEVGEKVHISDGGLTVEHDDCVRHWFRSNFGRESLR